MLRRRRGGLAAAAVIGLLALAAWVATGGPRDSRSVPAPAGPSPAGAASPAAYSIAGTTPDGAAQASANDTLLPDPRLIRLFEYYLSTVGERPLADIQAQIERDLDSRLGPNPARQAKDVLARYLAYKQALQTESVTSAASGPAVDRLRTALAATRATRSRYFGPAESRALFAPDDAAAQAALERLSAEQDPATSPAERRARLAALDKAAPAAAEAREASGLVNRLNEEAQRILAQGGSEDDVYRMRAAATSPEAANRLADLDRDEARWKSRVDDYLEQRRAWRAGPDADSNIAALRARLFTPDEQRRLPAYEQ